MLLIASASQGLYDNEPLLGNRTSAEIIRDLLLSHIVLMTLVILVIDYDSGVALRFVNFYELNYDCPLFEWCPDV